ncbi:hypothetical protein H4R24_000917 [Coemansia sp. RSA 988]|nr:hypothetical protein H4R24_000917 [Coemansia sp. RSA 988]
MNQQQFTQFLQNMQGMHQPAAPLNYTDFKGVVTPLIQDDRKIDIKYSSDSVNWLVNADRHLNTAGCPANQKVVVAADCLPADKANRYYADCRDKAVDCTLRTNFEKLVTKQYSNVVNYVDACFFPDIACSPDINCNFGFVHIASETISETAKIGTQSTMLFFLSRMPQNVISCILMEARNDRPIEFEAVRTLAANRFGSLAIAAHTPIEVDAATTSAPPANLDATRSGYRG